MRDVGWLCLPHTDTEAHTMNKHISSKLAVFLIAGFLLLLGGCSKDQKPSTAEPKASVSNVEEPSKPAEEEAASAKPQADPKTAETNGDEPSDEEEQEEGKEEGKGIAPTEEGKEEGEEDEYAGEEEGEGEEYDDDDDDDDAPEGD
jgi:flagellar biosynthesis/type III secretory pathway M-ring protein FliF/YscJ